MYSLHPKASPPLELTDVKFGKDCDMTLRRTSKANGIWHPIFMGSREGEGFQQSLGVLHIFYPVTFSQV